MNMENFIQNAAKNIKVDTFLLKNVNSLELDLGILIVTVIFYPDYRGGSFTIYMCKE